MRHRDRALGAAFAALVLVLGLWSLACALPFHWPQEARLLDGGVARRFEARYDAAFPVKTFGTNLWAAIELALFDEGRSGVVVGRDGWLYTLEEFRAYPDADVQVQAHLRLIERVHETLQQRGIELVVALLPAKARLYPEHLKGESPPRVQQTLYRRVRSDLIQSGISAPDLQAALGWCKQSQSVYLRTDTHWTPAGASCVAQALARSGTADVRLRRGEQRFVTELQPPQAHRGDLMQFLPLTPYFEALLPKPDPLAIPSTRAEGENDLLSDTPAPEVVLVGTSYSADPRWNFDGALRQAYGEDVLNLAKVGQGPFSPMLDYLQVSSTETQPRQVIWEIPERYLPVAQPLESKSAVQLAQLQSRSLPLPQMNQENAP